MASRIVPVLNRHRHGDPLPVGRPRSTRYQTEAVQDALDAQRTERRVALELAAERARGKVQRIVTTEVVGARFRGPAEEVEYEVVPIPPVSDGFGSSLDRRNFR